MMTKAVAGKRARTRQAIIDAAMHIIADKGLEATSIDELMQAAGMARATFYNYFQSRDDVLTAVVEQVRQHLHEKIESAIPHDYPPQVLVACMMYGILQYSLNQPCLGWVLVRLGGDNDWMAPYDVENGQFPRADNAILALIKRDIPFSIIHTYVEGAVNNLLRRSLKNHITIDEAEQIIGLILRGLGVDDELIDNALQTARDFAATIRA